MPEHLPPKKERRITRCINRGCNETFTYLYPTVMEKDAHLIITMSCPYCRTHLQVDLSPYAKDKIISYKSADTTIKNIAAVIFDLPTELPTSIRE